MSQNGASTKDKRPGLRMRIVGPSAEELDQRDANPEEMARWASVLSIAKRMSQGDPWERAAKKRRRKPRKRPGAAKRIRTGKAGDVLSAPSSPQNEQDHDPTIGIDVREGTLEPPFPPDVLCELYENSGPLRRNIDAMVTNIDSFGHRFEPVIDFTDPEVNNVIRDLMIREAVGEKKTTEITPEDIQAATPDPEAVEVKRVFWEQLSKIEKGRLDSLFEFINPTTTFGDVREAMREHVEILGNGGWEVMREKEDDVNSEIQQVYFVPFTHMRLMRQDKKPTRVKMRVRRDVVTFQEMEADRVFRRYVRLHGQDRIFYKEFGDPRVVSRKTGRIFPEGQKGIDELIAKEGEDKVDEDGKAIIPALANEFYHWKIRSPTSPYGVPRWIGELISVFGTRSAEEVNLAYFENKSIPPMVLLVSGGRVAESSIERIETYIEDQIKGKKNFHKIMVLEGLPSGAEETSGDVEHSGKMRIELVPLLKELPQDALFQKYDKNNQDKIGRAFRQPPLFTGDTTDMNRATAEVAKALVEEQVYQPARDKFDSVMNRFFLPNHDIRFWRFRTNAPVQRFPNDLVNNVAKSMEKGAITPNEARQLLSDAFSIDLPHRTEDWAKIPPRLAEVAARAGAMVSAEPGIMPELDGEEGEEGMDPELEEVVEQAAGRTSVIRGFTDVQDDHRHEFILMGKRLLMLPAPGTDGHVHEAIPPGDLLAGRLVKIATADANGHSHSAEFTVPITRRQRSAIKTARGLYLLREALAEVAADHFVAGEQDAH